MGVVRIDMIKELAQKIIIALGIVPEEDVKIDLNQLDWDGGPQIYITSEPTKADAETQMGLISFETVMGIRCIAKSREQAWDTIRPAVRAVYDKFCELERTRGSGILAITYIEHNIYQNPDRGDGFFAFFSFRVLTSIL